MTIFTEALFAKRARMCIKKFNNYQPLYNKFKVLTPLYLNDNVSNKGETSKEAVCLQELSVMLACWKSNDYVESKCSNEIASFKKCYNASEEFILQQKEALEKGTVLGKSRLPAKKVNSLLRRYPMPYPRY